MLDIAWTELLIIAVVAILVVGPRELPRMLLGLGKFMGTVRRTAGDFQRQFNDALREAELDELKRGMDQVRSANPLNKFKDDLNPLKQAGDSVRKAVEDPGAPKPSASGGASGTAHASRPAETADTPKSGAGPAAAATASATTRPAASAKPKPASAAAKPASARAEPAAKPAAAAKPKPATASSPKPASKPRAAPKPKPAAARGASKPGPTG